MRFFIAGATGFIGRHLTRKSIAEGHQVTVLTRSKAKATKQFSDLEKIEIVEGDPVSSGDWQNHVKGADVIINLAGEPVDGKRWNAQFKQKIMDSRVDSTRFLVETVASLDQDERPSAFICASGTDFYPLFGDHDLDADDKVDESHSSGDSFLARVCKHWEREAFEAKDLGLRVVVMRTGLVAGPGGGFDKLVTQFRLFAGGSIGSGKQWTSWIHLEDAVNAYFFAATKESIKGPCNLVSPENARYKELAKALASAMGRPSWLPVPKAALKLALGDFANHIIQGRRTFPKKLLDHGYEFKHPDVSNAMKTFQW